MGRLCPVSRRELISRLRELDFQGPYSGGRHQFMVRGTQRIILPNPHKSLVTVDLLSRILRQAGLTREKWLGEEEVQLPGSTVPSAPGRVALLHPENHDQMHLMGQARFTVENGRCWRCGQARELH
jgi:predicted RNA binding protein YcfA (HicA-like mRNA interferase family)